MSSFSDTVRPSAFAVVRLTTRSCSEVDDEVEFGRLSATPRNKSHAKAANTFKANVSVASWAKYPSLSSTIRKPLFMHRKTYSALLTRLRQIEAKPENRKYKSKRLTERTLKPNSMYQVEVAHIANV